MLASMSEQLLSAVEVADLLNISQASLYQMRYHRTGPPAVRIGGRLRWRRSELDAWIDANTEAAGSAS